ncbi:MAG: hypothetical protein ABL927_07510 [Bdellovibrionales bacterium]
MAYTKDNNKEMNQDTKRLSSKQKSFVENQNHCALCNSLLVIKVESYLEDYFIREEAECTTCKIKTRVKNHKMQ